MPREQHDHEKLSFETLAVHAGAEPDELTGAVAPPIYQTSTYEQDAVGKPRRGYEYARSQNPTRERLERAVAALAASQMVSYARAKSEGLGFTPGTGMANVGLAPREVRLVILTLGLLLVAPVGLVALEVALAAIAILSTITTIQRIVHVLRQQLPGLLGEIDHQSARLEHREVVVVVIDDRGNAAVRIDLEEPGLLLLLLVE